MNNEDYEPILTAIDEWAKAKVPTLKDMQAIALTLTEKLMEISDTLNHFKKAPQAAEEAKEKANGAHKEEDQAPQA